MVCSQRIKQCLALGTGNVDRFLPHRDGVLPDLVDIGKVDNKALVADKERRIVQFLDRSF